MMISCLSLSVSKITNDIIGNVIMHDSVTIKRAPVCSKQLRGVGLAAQKTFWDDLKMVL